MRRKSPSFGKQKGTKKYIFRPAKEFWRTPNRGRWKIKKPHSQEELFTWVKTLRPFGWEMWITIQENRNIVEKYILGNSSKNKVS
jgi:hypothetical protein